LQLRKSRPALWELVVSVGLAVLTVKASRSGVWLVLFLAVPAARGLGTPRFWNWVMPPLGTLALAGLVWGVVRGPLPDGAGSGLVTRAIVLAHGSPILADDVIDEQVALAGGRIWVGNPIDAFNKRDQSTYLDWLAGRAGGARALGPEIRVVLTGTRSPAHRFMVRDTAFVRVASDARSVLFVRVRQ
jgi:hypothetical protein